MDRSKCNGRNWYSVEIVAGKVKYFHGCFETSYIKCHIFCQNYSSNKRHANTAHCRILIAQLLPQSDFPCFSHSYVRRFVHVTRAL